MGELLAALHNRAKQWPALAGCALIAAFALVFALVGQLAWHWRPCPWCIVQRIAYVLIGITGLIGTASMRLRQAEPAAGRWSVALPAVFVVVFAFLGAAAAAWQSFGPVASSGCALTLADRLVAASGLDVLLPLLFAATANCDEANIPLMGVPFGIWSLMVFILIALLAALAVRAPQIASSPTPSP